MKILPIPFAKALKNQLLLIFEILVRIPLEASHGHGNILSQDGRKDIFLYG
jgi:hypothetical protein